MLIIFDLDGVLIDSKELHYRSLNNALSKYGDRYVISREEHLAIFDGISTGRKLEILAEKKNLPRELFDEIKQLKQLSTIEDLKKIEKNEFLIEMFSKIKKEGIKISVASNSIRDTVKQSLIQLGIIEYVDYFVSNQDVRHIKPFPEMYWQCMIALKEIPSDTVIFEDSHIGRQAAIDSGARLIEIKDPSDLTEGKIDLAISLIKKKIKSMVPWKDKKLNVLIPMAGSGSRFASVGYTFPKPLIEVHDKPMIELVVNNLNIEANYIYLVQKQHFETYNLKYLLNLITPNCKIVLVDGVTEGAACTALLAKEYIDNENPLLIANSDQYVEWNSNESMYAMDNDEIDGGILTFKSRHPKWSYAAINDVGMVTEVAEKKVISENATCGIYFWKRGNDFVKYAEQMIDKNIRTNNEFYICPVYNEAIQDGKKIKIKEIYKMWGLGTPEDLDYFLKNKK